MKTPEDHGQLTRFEIGYAVLNRNNEPVRLRAGDLIVERGTDHSWRNEGSEPVGLAIVVATAT